jgi:hypothetical protein
MMRSVVVSMCTPRFEIRYALRRYTPTPINVQDGIVFHHLEERS